ncbi:MAG: hypothetical protein F4X65_09170 [Chloroflexi bacterium]|nr:hypothetical protein [Chloroflexota bacterium]
MNKNGWIGKVLLALAVLVPVVGMAASIYLASNGTSFELFATEDEPKAPESELVLSSEDFPTPAANVGNKVGYQVPEFTLTLADGRNVTSGELVNSGKPTFLFFWATI